MLNLETDKHECDVCGAEEGKGLVRSGVYDQYDHGEDCTACGLNHFSFSYGQTEERLGFLWRQESSGHWDDDENKWVEGPRGGWNDRNAALTEARLLWHETSYKTEWKDQVEPNRDDDGWWLMFADWMEDQGGLDLNVAEVRRAVETAKTLRQKDPNPMGL